MAAKKKLVKDIMTKGKVLVTCEPKDKVGDAMKRMSKNHISGLPVVDADGKVVGVVTEADVLLARKASSVNSVMASTPITIAAEATIKEAAEMLAKKKIKRALVVKDDGSLWGVVSRADVIRAMA